MSEKRPPYLKLPQDFFDLSASAAVGAVTLLVYLHIRRYVWRSGQRRGDFQPKPSQVVAYVNQSALGGAVGINRQNVSLHIGKLEKLGWLRRLNTNGDKTERVYEVGFRSKKGVGEDAEVYFADQRFAAFRKEVGGETLKTMNAEAKGEALRDFSGTPLVSPPRQALSRQQDEACLANKTSLVLLARHQNRERGNTQRGNSQRGKPLRGASAGAEAARSLRSRAAAAPAKKSKARPEKPTTPSSARPPPPTKGSDDVNRLDMLKLAEGLAKKKNSDTRLEKAEKRARREKNLGGVAGGKGAPIRRLYDVWHKLMCEKWPDLPEDNIGVWWTHRERPDGTAERRATKEAGQCQMLVKKFSEDAVEGYFRYAITNWEALRERFKKAPMIPSVGFLLALSGTLMPESALAGRKHSARAELEAWFEAHPGENPPEELMARFKGLNAAGG